jgi:hypothetical protein
VSAPAASARDEHLDENQVARHLSGEGSEEERAQVRVHIDACDRCRELLTSLVRTVIVPEPEISHRRALPRGTNLGRYVLLDPVGRGGMGVVYAAFDPELDRKVAIKLVRPGMAEGGLAAARTQLLSEAQAVARLSHPNLVTVYDVGTFGGEVFFAMEYVKGDTLRRVQRPGLAGLQHTLGLYVAAGEGLSAAHRAGIVHGDFKPENVLVGEDGRVRVTDFGLARAAQEKSTRMAGTPAYMAPEQWRGHPADVQSDQYGFCLALLEAVEGRRPPEVEDASPVRPPRPIDLRSRHLPPRLAPLLARGLTPNPAQRWPSMDALLSALRDARLPFRRSTALLASLLLLFTAAVWVQHAISARRLSHELVASAKRIPELLRAQSERVDLQVHAGLRAEGVLDAFGQASNMDAALGLAENDAREHQLAEAHEVLRSADLPGLRERDALLLINAWGRVLLNQAEPKAFGSPAPALPILVETMDEISGDALWSAATLDRLDIRLVETMRRGDILFVSGRSVVRGRSVVGGILTGAWLGKGLLTELERAAGTRIVLHAPDGGWAGGSWPEAPPLGRVVRLEAEGRPLWVYGIALGSRVGQALTGEAYAVHALTAEETTGLGSARVRWGLLAASGTVLIWLASLAWRSGWYPRRRTGDPT